MSPDLATSVSGLREFLAPVRRAGKAIGLVPTMGALHLGHRRLMDTARAETDVVVISKIDLAQACGYDRHAALANLRRAAPKAKVFETSAKTGEGIPAWRQFIVEQQQQVKARDPLAA